MIILNVDKARLTKLTTRVVLCAWWAGEGEG